MRQAPPLALLGLCERAEKAIDPSTGLYMWNALGIRSFLGSFIFPLPLKGWNFLFALYEPRSEESFEVVIRDEARSQVGSFNVTLSVAKQGEIRDIPPLERQEFLRTPGGWCLDFVPCGSLGPMIPLPGRYTFFLKDSTEETSIGSIYFGMLSAPPLSPDRVAALRSDPAAAKMVKLHAECGLCKERLGMYAGLERSSAMAADGYIWYADLPDTFKCKCGGFWADLRIIRTNLPALLGQRTSPRGEASIVPLYERMGIEAIRSNLLKLLNDSTREEDIQIFLNENPLALHICCPTAVRIIAKAPILTRYVTDFAILGANHELIVVELEKAQTTLMTKRGGIAAPLQHAFDQANEWLQLVDDQRSAFLDALNIDPKTVAKVRGVVIAGRDRPYDIRHLRTLKGRDFARVTFLSYDDVAASLQELAERVGEL